MLQVRALTKTFGSTTALKAVNLDVTQGEMVGVIGRSGAGKSTLLRLINRLAEPSSGSIRCHTQEVTQLRGQELRLWRAVPWCFSSSTWWAGWTC